MTCFNCIAIVCIVPVLPAYRGSVPTTSCQPVHRNDTQGNSDIAIDTDVHLLHGTAPDGTE